MSEQFKHNDNRNMINLIYFFIIISFLELYEDAHIDNLIAKRIENMLHTQKRNNFNLNNFCN